MDEDTLKRLGQYKEHISRQIDLADMVLNPHGRTSEGLGQNRERRNAYQDALNILYTTFPEVKPQEKQADNSRKQ